MRKRSKRGHLALVGVPIGVWHPAAVGVVPGYPPTRAAFEKRRATLRANGDAARAAGKTSRQGIPSGWAGRREEVAAIRQQAFEDAKRCLGVTDAGRPPEDVSDDEAGNLALAYLLSVVRSEAYSHGDRLKAARAILPYLKEVPVRQGAVTLGSALRFLEGLC